MTFLFDREKAMAALEGFEAGWGGTIEERMARDFAAWKAGANRPPPEGAAEGLTEPEVQAPSINASIASWVWGWLNRSDASSVGKEGVSTCRSRCPPIH